MAAHPEEDRLTTAVRLGALLLPGALLVGMLGILLARGGAALDPVFWFTASEGAAGGGVRRTRSSAPSCSSAPGP
ncbi:hypothetical protein [Streptomyces narbonensis]